MLPFGLTYYYVLLIFIGVSLIVIVWLLLTIRSLQASSDEYLKRKVLVSEKVLRLLRLDKPDLTSGTVTPPETQPDMALSKEETIARLDNIKSTYDQLKNLVGLKYFLAQTKISDVMIGNVISLKTTDSFHQAALLMEKHAIRHLPVIAAADKIVGLVTQRDLYRICAPRRLDDGSLIYPEGKLDQYILENVMTKHPATIRDNQPLGDAILKMIKDDYGCLPVVDATDSLCGIITRGDILRLTGLVYLSDEINK